MAAHESLQILDSDLGAKKRGLKVTFENACNLWVGTAKQINQGFSFEDEMVVKGEILEPMKALDVDANNLSQEILRIYCIAYGYGIKRLFFFIFQM